MLSRYAHIRSQVRRDAISTLESRYADPISPTQKNDGAKIDGWTAPRSDNGLKGPRWYVRPPTTMRGASEDASYYSRYRSGREPVSDARLRCQRQGGGEQIAYPSTAADICRDAATVPGRDGDVRDGALPGARDSEAP